MKIPEKFKRKLAICILTYLMCSFSPVIAWGSAVIKDFRFVNNPGGKTEIIMDSSGGFRYFIYANSNDLIIDIKGAKVAENILGRLNNTSYEENNIENLKVENISNDFARVTIGLNDIRDFKFIVKSNKGEAAPYGFSSQAGEVVQKSKMKTRQPAYNPPTTNKKQDENSLKTAHNRLDESQVDNPQKEEIPLRDKVRVEPVKQEIVRQEPLKDDLMKEETPELVTKNFDKEDIVLVGESIVASKSNKTNSTSKQSRRLDEDSVVIPENYLMKEVTEEETVDIEEETYVQEAEIEPEAPKSTKPERDPLPTEELMKLLTSNSTSNKEIPRLVSDAKAATRPKESQEPVSDDIFEESRSNDHISKVDPLPKGTPIPVNADGITDISTDGASIIDVASALNTSDQEQTYSQKESLNSNLLEPRDLNYMPLGLSETYYYSPKEEVSLDSLKAKPAYTSDGQMAIKIYSADGISNKKAAIRQVETQNSGNTVVLNNSSDRVYEPYGGQTGFVDSTFKSLINKANSLYKTGRTDEAEQAYRKAIEYDTEVPWGYIALAGFYESQNQFEKAANAYRKAVKLLPGKPEVLYNLSLSNYKSNRYNEAVENLREVISLSPNFTLAYYNLGTLYYKMNKIEEAIKYLTKAIQLNPVLTDAHYNLGLAYVLKDKPDDAANSFKLCTSIDPDDSSCAKMLSGLK